MLKRFDEELVECLLDVEKKSMRTEVDLGAKKVQDDVNRENRDSTLLKIKQVIQARMQELRNKFENFCQENIPLEEGKLLGTE